MGRVIRGEGAPTQPGVPNMTWMGRGWTVMCTLCGLHLGKKTKFYANNAPVCRKCHKAYSQLQAAEQRDGLDRREKVLLARAQEKLSKYREKEQARKKKAALLNTSMDHAKKHW